MNKLIIKRIKKILSFFHLHDFIISIYFSICKLRIISKNKINRLTKKTVVILLYHRIDSLLNDPQMLAVTKENFDEHINFLKTKFTIISLNELVMRLKNKKIMGNEVCITFDDGYRDNLTNALPVLEKHSAPATIFITTSQIGKQANFAWDKKYNDLDKAFFLSENEIKNLSQNPLIEIGAHTHNHSRLSDLSQDDQLFEIQTGKNILEDIIGKKVLHFAYPFGGKRDFNKKTIEIVKDLGFVSAYENTGLLGTTFSDLYYFPRINIRTCAVAQLEKQLK